MYRKQETVMSTSALAIFTGKGTAAVLETGGSQSWVLDRNKARVCKYAVLYFNEHAPWSTKGSPTPHHHAFLVGRISDVTRSSDVDHPDRWRVEFDEYAEVKDAGAWGGWRNPVRYTTLEELGIDESQLEFKPMPAHREFREIAPQSRASRATSEPMHLTIESAKAGLAATYGVKPEAIEIIIRG
jgi:hypothetical protein